jgi:hypothetical protein
MSLAKDILNGKQALCECSDNDICRNCHRAWEGLNALCVPDEIAEVKAVFNGGRVTLKRTFNITIDGVTLKFWRVTGPANHPNFHSDLSVEGLKEWGII